MNDRSRMETVTDQVTPRLIAGLQVVLDQDEPDPGQLPQCGHWALCPPPISHATTGADGHRRLGDFLPDTGLPRRMWASGEVEFRHPIRAGMSVMRHSIVSDVTEKTGKSGRLAFATVLHRLMAEDVLLISEKQVIVYREASTGAVAAGPAPDLEAPDFDRIILPDPVMLFRYSALTSNGHRIHYDQPYATGVEGYPGLVTHGPLIASLLADLVARQLGPDRLLSFSWRGIAPAFSGQALRLCGRIRGDVVSLWALGPAGGLVMTAEGRI